MAAPPSEDGVALARSCMSRAVDCEIMVADVLNEHHHPLQKLRAMHSAERLAACDLQSLHTWGMPPSAIPPQTVVSPSATSLLAPVAPLISIGSIGSETKSPPPIASPSPPPPIFAPLTGPSNPGWWPSPALDGRADMASNLRRLQPGISQVLLSRLTSPSASSTLRLAAARQLQLLIDQLGPSLGSTLPSLITAVHDAFTMVLGAAATLGLSADSPVDSPDGHIPPPPQLKSEVKPSPLAEVTPPPAPGSGGGSGVTLSSFGGHHHGGLTRPKRLIIEDDRKNGGWPRPRSADKNDSPEKKANAANDANNATGEKDSTIIHNPVDRARQAHRISQLLEQLLSLVKSVHSLVADLAPRPLLQLLPSVLASLRSLHAIQLACNTANGSSTTSTSFQPSPPAVPSAPVNLSAPGNSPSAVAAANSSAAAIAAAATRLAIIGASARLVALRLSLMQMLASLLYRLQSDATPALCFATMSSSSSSTTEPPTPSSRLAGSFSSFGVTATPRGSPSGRSSFSGRPTIVQPLDTLTLIQWALRSSDGELREAALLVWRLLVEHLPRGIASRVDHIRSFANWAIAFLRTRPPIAPAALTVPVGGMAMAAAAAAATGGAPHPAMAGADTAHSSLCLALDLMRAVALQCTIVHDTTKGSNNTNNNSENNNDNSDAALQMEQHHDIFAEWVNTLTLLVEDHCRLCSGGTPAPPSEKCSTPDATDGTNAFPSPPSPSVNAASSAPTPGGNTSPALSPAPASAGGKKAPTGAVNWNVVNATGPCPSPRLLELLLASWNALVAVASHGVSPVPLALILPTSTLSMNGIGSNVRAQLILPRVTARPTTPTPIIANSLQFIQPLLHFAIAHCEHSSPPLLLLQLLCGMLPSIRTAIADAAATAPRLTAAERKLQQQKRTGTSATNVSSSSSSTMHAVEHFLALFCQWVPHSVHDETFQLLHVLLDLLTPTLSGPAVVAASDALLNRYTVRTQAATRARTTLLTAILQTPKSVQCVSDLVDWALALSETLTSSSAATSSSGRVTSGDVLLFKKRHTDLLHHEQQKERIGLLCDCLAVASAAADDDSGSPSTTTARSVLKSLAVPYTRLQSIGRMCTPLLSAADARTSLSAVFIMDHAISALTHAIDRGNSKGGKPLNEAQSSFKVCSTFLTTALDVSIRRSDSDTTFATIRSLTTLLAALLFPSRVRSSALSSSPDIVTTDLKESPSTHGQRTLAFGIMTECLPLLSHMVEIATHQQLRLLCLWTMVVWSWWGARLMSHNWESTEYRPLQMELSRQCLQLVKASDSDSRVAGARMAASLAGISFSLTRPVPSTALFPSFYLWTPSAVRGGTSSTVVPLLVNDEVFVHVAHSLSDELCTALRLLRRADGQPAVQLASRALQLASGPCPHIAIVACDPIEIHQLGLGTAPTSLTLTIEESGQQNGVSSSGYDDDDAPGLFGTISRAYRLPSPHGTIAPITPEPLHDTPWRSRNTVSDTSLQPLAQRRTWADRSAQRANQTGIGAVVTGDISIEMLRRLVHVDDILHPSGSNGNGIGGINGRRAPASPQLTSSGYEETLEELGVLEDDSPGFGDDDDDLITATSNTQNGKANGTPASASSSSGRHTSGRRPPPLSLNVLPKNTTDLLNPGEASPPIGGMGSPPLVRGISPTSIDTSPPNVISPPNQQLQRPSTAGTSPIDGRPVRPQSAGRRRPNSAGSNNNRGISPPQAPGPNSQKPSWSSRPPTVPTAAWGSGGAAPKRASGTPTNSIPTPTPPVANTAGVGIAAAIAAVNNPNIAAASGPVNLVPPGANGSPARDWGSSPPVSPTDVPPMTFNITIDSPQPSTSGSPSSATTSPAASHLTSPPSISVSVISPQSQSGNAFSGSPSTTTTTNITPPSQQPSTFASASSFSSSPSSSTNGIVTGAIVSPRVGSTTTSSNVTISSSAVPTSSASPRSSSVQSSSSIAASSTSSSVLSPRAVAASSLAALDIGNSTQSPPRLISVSDRPGASLSSSVVRPVASSPLQHSSSSPSSSTTSLSPTSLHQLQSSSSSTSLSPPLEPHPFDETLIPTSIPSLAFGTTDDDDDGNEDDEDDPIDDDDLSPDPEEMDALKTAFESIPWDPEDDAHVTSHVTVPPLRRPATMPISTPAKQSLAKSSNVSSSVTATVTTSSVITAATTTTTTTTTNTPVLTRPVTTPISYAAIVSRPRAASTGSAGSRSPGLSPLVSPIVSPTGSAGRSPTSTAAIAANRARTSVSPQLVQAETEDIIAKFMASSSASLAAAPDRNKLAQGLGSLLSSFGLPNDATTVNTTASSSAPSPTSPPAAANRRSTGSTPPPISAWSRPLSTSSISIGKSSTSSSRPAIATLTAAELGADLHSRDEPSSTTTSSSSSSSGVTTSYMMARVAAAAAAANAAAAAAAATSPSSLSTPSTTGRASSRSPGRSNGTGPNAHRVPPQPSVCLSSHTFFLYLFVLF
jgi:hypothetical protein